MLTVVVVFNVLISLLCLYVAWRVWKLRRVLAEVADIVAAAERSTYAVLHGAPKAIYKGQLGTHGLREHYQQLVLQLQRVEQVLTILGLLQSVWRTALRFSRKERGIGKCNSADAAPTRSQSRRLRYPHHPRRRQS